MKIKTAYLTGPTLDWAVAKAQQLVEGGPYDDFCIRRGKLYLWCNGALRDEVYSPTTNWLFGGPLIDRENITIIRADDYETDADGFTTNKRIPQWFAECSRWTGHGLTTCYEGENMDPIFMISEDSGYYGPTPLIAAMRSFVASKMGEEVEIPEELL